MIIKNIKNKDLVKKLLVIGVSLAIGLCLGITYAKEFILNASDCQILYVAQDELMELENNRTKDFDPKERQLFFGKIEEAVNLATQLPKAYVNRTTRVVYSMSAVQGDNVKSISRQIHDKIIEELVIHQKD